MKVFEPGVKERLFILVEILGSISNICVGKSCVCVLGTRPKASANGN